MKRSMFRRVSMSLVLGLSILLFAGLVSQIWTITGESSALPLNAPGFVKTAVAAPEGGSGFPENEAGISAYFKTGSIDLNDVRDAYRAIEVETSDYIIGSVAVPDYASEDNDVHVYIHVDGWVLAYYLYDDPAAKIIDWRNFDGNTITTKFDNVLTIIAAELSIGLPTIDYYDFRHPNANSLLLIAEAQFGSGDDSFEVELPSGLTYYERSWSHSCFRLDSGNRRSQFYFNGVEIDEITCAFSNTAWPNSYGSFTAIEMQIDMLHTLRIDTFAANSYSGLALVYLEP